MCFTCDLMAVTKSVSLFILRLVFPKLILKELSLLRMF